MTHSQTVKSTMYPRTKPCDTSGMVCDTMILIYIRLFPSVTAFHAHVLTRTHSLPRLNGSHSKTALQCLTI